MARPLYQVQLHSVTDFMQRAGKIEFGRLTFRRAVADGMARKVRERIRSRSGRLAGSWQGHVTSTDKVLVRSVGVVYAKASVGGTYTTPTNKKALRFADGRFAKFVRINPGAWVGLPHDRRTSYVSLAFKEFGDVARTSFRLVFGRSPL